MNQWTNASTYGVERDATETIAIELEIQPRLRSIVVTLEPFPLQAFNAWKLQVLIDPTNHCEAQKDWESWSVLVDQPQGVAIACDEALNAVSGWLDEVLQRLGAGGWNSLMPAWERTLRDRLHVVEGLSLIHI